MKNYPACKELKTGFRHMPYVPKQHDRPAYKCLGRNNENTIILAGYVLLFKNCLDCRQPQKVREIKIVTRSPKVRAILRCMKFQRNLN